jgi:hypothetical protein
MIWTLSESNRFIQPGLNDILRLRPVCEPCQLDFEGNCFRLCIDRPTGEAYEVYCPPHNCPPLGPSCPVGYERCGLDLPYSTNWICCSPGEYCCNDEWHNCCPNGTQCCGTTGCCQPGTSCTIEGCCKNNLAMDSGHCWTGGVCSTSCADGDACNCPQGSHCTPLFIGSNKPNGPLVCCPDANRGNRSCCGLGYAPNTQGGEGDACLPV